MGSEVTVAIAAAVGGYFFGLRAKQNKEMETIMADLATDTTRFNTDITALTAAVTAIQTGVAAQASLITSLQSQVAALSGTVDTSGLEADLSSLESQTSALNTVAQSFPAPQALPVVSSDSAAQASGS